MRARTLILFSRSLTAALCATLVFSLSLPFVAQAAFMIQINFGPPTPNLDLSLAINGTPVVASSTVNLLTGKNLPVSISVSMKSGDNSILDGSQNSQTYWDAFYLDFYKGTAFSGATFISGEQMNAASSTLKSTSTVTFPGPGTYSAVLYDSGNVRDYFAMCPTAGSCSPQISLSEIRSSIETWPDLGAKQLDPIGVVTFTIPPPDPCSAPGSCASNVLFLPGIEGTRLYEGTGCGKSAEEKLWEPYDGLWNAVWGAGDKKVRDLSLNSTGESSCSDIYTKEGDILDSVGGGNIYQSFIDEMNGLKSDGTIKDWQPVAYDWRLSLPDLLTKGAEHDGKIYYEEATSTPYIEQTLRRLAASSKTGKVTVVAHSNGGLVAKALMQNLGATTTAELIDKVIMVAVPQSGAPYAVGALLVGDNAGIYSHGIQIVSNEAVRNFSQNSSMVYHLLPSQTYFDSVMYDPAHPVARFEGDGYAAERAAYGGVIGTETELDNFLLAKDGGRTQAPDEDLSAAKILNPVLVSYATSTHATLDSWTPPAGITVDQIAGWGVDTVAGIDFYSQQSWFSGTQRLYRPISVEDGDGTVPVASAFGVATSAGVKDYWINLATINNIPGTKIKRTHADLFETPSLQGLIKNLIENSTSTLPSYIQDTRPSPNDTTKKLTYLLHSPLTLQLTDASGNVTGMSPDGSVTENIPGSTYSEFGEVKYVTVPEGGAYELTMHGLSSGVFSLDMQERIGDTITASSTIADVPTTASTTVTMAIPSDVSTLLPVNVDENGDGKIDSVIIPKLGNTVIFDRVPPELHLTFSTTTQSFVITGTDDQGSVTLTSTTTQSAHFMKKQQRRAEDEREQGRDSHEAEAVTTTAARDMAGNTTDVSYTTTASSREGKLSINILSLAYNGATTTLPESTLSFTWGKIRAGQYKTFESVLHTATTTITTRYQSKPDRTIITTSIQDEKRNKRNDEKKHTAHSVREVVAGMVIPYMATEKGNMLISY
ncbi:MAG: lipase/acyltransferase domain-containing protein [Minisyncoccota bacterium]